MSDELKANGITDTPPVEPPGEVPGDGDPGPPKG